MPTMAFSKVLTVSGSPLLVALSNLHVLEFVSWSIARPSRCRRAASLAVMSRCSSACNSPENVFFFLAAGCCVGEGFDDPAMEVTPVGSLHLSSAAIVFLKSTGALDALLSARCCCRCCSLSSGSFW